MYSDIQISVGQFRAMLYIFLLYTEKKYVSSKLYSPIILTNNRYFQSQIFVFFFFDMAYKS